MPKWFFARPKYTSGIRYAIFQAMKSSAIPKAFQARHGRHGKPSPGTGAKWPVSAQDRSGAASRQALPSFPAVHAVPGSPIPFMWPLRREGRRQNTAPCRPPFPGIRFRRLRPVPGTASGARSPPLPFRKRNQAHSGTVSRPCRNAAPDHRTSTPAFALPAPSA